MKKMMGAIAGQMSRVFRTRKSLFFKIVLFWKSVVQGSPQAESRVTAVPNA